MTKNFSESLTAALEVIEKEIKICEESSKSGNRDQSFKIAHLNLLLEIVKEQVTYANPDYSTRAPR